MSYWLALDISTWLSLLTIVNMWSSLYLLLSCCLLHFNCFFIFFIFSFFLFSYQIFRCFWKIPSKHRSFFKIETNSNHHDQSEKLLENYRQSIKLGLSCSRRIRFSVFLGINGYILSIYTQLQVFNSFFSIFIPSFNAVYSS